MNQHRMTRMRLWVYLIAFTVTLSSLVFSQSGPYREYRFLFGQPYELDPIATAGTSLNKVFQDMYYRGIGPRLPERLQPIAETVWAVYWTYIFSLWPHEFGHWARARQVGGDFIIHGFSFPFPKAEMDLPASLSVEEETLASIGGHEINNLMMRQTHLDFYQHHYAYADELIHAFIQEVYFTFYAFVIAPANPEEPSTWTSTVGDPVESALSVYENYTSRPAIRQDGSVDPELSSYYQEAVYLSVLWIMLDPMLYQSAKAFGADMEQNHGLLTPRMFGDEIKAWIWGTQFNPSPLGYELYLTNYLRFNRRLYALYIKAGRPYRNTGIGIQVPGLVEQGKFTLGAACDLWDQDMYGRGAAIAFDVKYQFYKGFGLLLKGGWKDEGYLLGKRIDKSATFFVGVSYQR
ncbi:MAG: hypothetical protein ACETWG_06495 [Candidatus Neomarinimicrobiota bacterium]